MPKDNARDYYQMSPEEVQFDLNGHTGSLSTKEVAEKQALLGPNQLSEGHKKTPLRIFLEQFKDFLVIILIVAATVSAILNDVKSAVVIVIVVMINAVLGLVQTLKAEQSLRGLKQLSAPTTKVVRNGEVEVVPTTEVTVGDTVLLEAGDYISADGRLIECAALKVDESALTGESVGVDKSLAGIDGDVPLGDRLNMVYSGSFVTYGRGSFVVTAIGMQTEVGKIATLLNTAAEKRTPLQVSLDAFGQRLSIAIIGLCVVLFGLNVLRGGDIVDAFLFAVALAVAAIPEALSSIVTIVLSIGTQKMAKEHAIIRKLQAVEGLGSVSIICSDKTGTLTQNKMTVEDYYVDGACVAVDDFDADDEASRMLMTFSVLCNDSTNKDGIEIGDPTETALINLASKARMSVEDIRGASPRLAEVPFDSERKLMSTLNRMTDGATLLIVKGAIDVITQRVDRIWTAAGVRELTADDRARIEAQNLVFSQNGLRVLGFAYKEMSTEGELTTADEHGLIFMGLIAMMDPPRPESAAAVAECKRAGIRPIMITGDHKITAAAIARRIGILEDDSEACEGAEIDGMSDSELEDFVPRISVYARVSPEHKIRIVRAWQDLGNIVAMTGDGVNDAPALKQADIGVAMGITGTEVSKDASSMVLTDDNFATIVKAVENGRNLYRNIKHAIEFLLSGNFAAILTVLYASLVNLPVPFAPVHLLFINLLTDSLPAIALGVEPHSSDVMDMPPRAKSEPVLTKDSLLRIGYQGLSIGATTLLAFFIGLHQSELLAMTLAFGTLCTARLIHGFNSKSDKPILFTRKMWNNTALIGAFLLGLVLITVVLTVPVLESVFSVQALTFSQLLLVYGLALLNLPIIQGIKWVVWRLRS
ncbi:MAG: cation-translocating P-type ATPase [Coriobacteriia bacterium]|nr:cation-translocating P-type ATPase [Coriobacteriia bacterium]